MTESCWRCGADVPAAEIDGWGCPRCPEERAARKTVATHNGVFHADDAFAIATLRLIYGAEGIEVHRSRDPKVLEAADLRVDVGGQNAPLTGDFDHHQKGGAGSRPSGIPYAAFGLVWNSDFGAAAVATALGLPPDGGGCLPPLKEEGRTNRQKICRLVDQRLVQQVDAADSGFNLSMGETVGGVKPMTVSGIISSLNPGWDEEGDFDGQFVKAVDLAENALRREILRAAGVVKAAGVVQKALNDREDPRVLVLPRFCPWQDALFQAEEGGGDVFFVAFPSETGDWRLQCCPPEQGGFDKKMPLPEGWAGQRGEDLAKMTGVEDAIFCHPGRFICGALSRAGVLQLAKLALEDEE